MHPDAIIVLSGGSVPLGNGREGPAGFRSTTYEERDAFGTLGGRARVEAAAVLATRFPDAVIVATCKRGNEAITHAQIIAHELTELGVSRERILLEERSETTREQVKEALALAAERGWALIVFVSNEYHLPRVRAFSERMHPAPSIEYISAESVLSEHDPEFASRFAMVKQTPAYQERLTAEKNGLEAIERGTYESAPPQDKKEQ